MGWGVESNTSTVSLVFILLTGLEMISTESDSIIV